MNRDTLSKMRKLVKALTFEARHGLRYSEYVKPPLIDSQGYRFGRPRLLLWQDAEGFSDDEPQSLTVFQPFRNVAPLVRKTVWKRSVDMRPLQEVAEARSSQQPLESQPTFEVSDRRIDGLQFEALLNDATGLRIPVVWAWPKDLDGLTEDVGMVGFEYFDQREPQARVQCCWSMDLPPEWEPIIHWFAQMSDWLEGHFREEAW